MGKKVVRVFLDSNVILTGFISERGAPRIILNLLSLRLPFLMGSAYLPKLNLRVIPLPRPKDVRGFSGQIAEKDIPILISAIRSKAEFLVTGDKQNLEK